MLAAAKVMNQLSWLAKDGGRVDIVLREPNEEMRALGTELARRVPQAWCDGHITIELQITAATTVTWTVCNIPQPATEGKTYSTRRTANLMAGVVLCMMFGESVRDVVAGRAG